MPHPWRQPWVIHLLGCAALPLVDVDKVRLIGKSSAVTWLPAKMDKCLAILLQLGKPQVLGRLRAADESALHHWAHLVVMPSSKLDDGFGVEAAVFTVKPTAQNLVGNQRCHH